MPHGLGLPYCFCIRCMCPVCLQGEVDGTSASEEATEVATEEVECGPYCPCEPCHGEEDWFGQEEPEVPNGELSLEEGAEMAARANE